mmetsp:Transcript_31762/g.80796  ORF Transcript_31762/g.80796 Transcript_31762/m.80796 type:complete len:308 (+) Transcript_31762:516-1439(+)
MAGGAPGGGPVVDARRVRRRGGGVRLRLRVRGVVFHGPLGPLRRRPGVGLQREAVVHADALGGALVGQGHQGARCDPRGLVRALAHAVRAGREGGHPFGHAQRGRGVDRLEDAPPPRRHGLPGGALPPCGRQGARRLLQRGRVHEALRRFPHVRQGVVPLLHHRRDGGHLPEAAVVVLQPAQPEVLLRGAHVPSGARHPRAAAVQQAHRRRDRDGRRGELWPGGQLADCAHQRPAVPEDLLSALDCQEQLQRGRGVWGVQHPPPRGDRRPAPAAQQPRGQRPGQRVQHRVRQHEAALPRALLERHAG